MIKKILKVKGMFCNTCENRIQNKLKSIDGIEYANADFTKKELEIEYNEEKVSEDFIRDTIDELGYELILGKDGDLQDNIQIVSILVIILALYVIFNHLGVLNIFNIFPSIETTMSYGMLFVVGLLTSVHCIAMCGGINLSQSVINSQNNEKAIKSNLYYNVGRVISYTVIGGIVGWIGSIISLNGAFKGIIAIIAGIIMIIMSINMLGIKSPLRKLNIRIPKKITMALNKTKKGKSSFYIGLLNGLMPCGPLQSMQIYALSTGSFFGGAISMLLFSLGTVPLMFGFGMIASKLNKKFASKMLTVSAIIIFILALGMLRNGLSLSGISIPNLTNNYENQATIVGDHQEITTEIDYGSYETITVKKNIPVKWTINVPKEKLNGCNSEIIIPKYNIDIKLTEGDNIVEFMPTTTGTIPYSCWMGMINSSINVID